MSSHLKETGGEWSQYIYKRTWWFWKVFSCERNIQNVKLDWKESSDNLFNCIEILNKIRFGFTLPCVSGSKCWYTNRNIQSWCTYRVYMSIYTESEVWRVYQGDCYKRYSVGPSSDLVSLWRKPYARNVRLFFLCGQCTNFLYFDLYLFNACSLIDVQSGLSGNFARRYNFR